VTATDRQATAAAGTYSIRIREACQVELTKRRLGTSGPEITTVGFGSWAVGGDGWLYGWGPQDDATSIAAIRHAVASGVNWIDTAAVYGLGHSEEVVGRALRTLTPGERPFVFTKGGEVFDPARPFDEPVHSLEPASIRREVEASLRRLGIERIDLYQFHWPDDVTGTPVEDSWVEMGRLVDEGKIWLAGVCNFDVGLLDRCESIHHVASLQPHFSLIRRASGAEVIPWAAEHGTGVIVYGTMQHGVLTETFSAGQMTTVAADDWRRRDDAFTGPGLARSLALRDALRAIARRNRTTVEAVAVAWALAWPGVTGAIVGARRPEQVDGWIRAGSFELAIEDLDEIAAAIERIGVGSGPLRPDFSAG
jgi:aryl-alcohol dehydrogenase-like predicted oxidoreductase